MAHREDSSRPWGAEWHSLIDKTDRRLLAHGDSAPRRPALRRPDVVTLCIGFGHWSPRAVKGRERQSGRAMKRLCAAVMITATLCLLVLLVTREPASTATRSQVPRGEPAAPMSPDSARQPNQSSDPPMANGTTTSSSTGTELTSTTLPETEPTSESATPPTSTAVTSSTSNATTLPTETATTVPTLATPSASTAPRHDPAAAAGDKIVQYTSAGYAAQRNDEAARSSPSLSSTHPTVADLATPVIRFSGSTRRDPGRRAATDRAS